MIITLNLKQLKPLRVTARKLRSNLQEFRTLVGSDLSDEECLEASRDLLADLPKERKGKKPPVAVDKNRGTRSALIRSMPGAKPAEILKAAAAAGIEMNVDLVYNVRSLDRKLAKRASPPAKTEAADKLPPLWVPGPDTLKGRVLKALRKVSPNGLTAQQLGHALNAHASSVRSACRRLARDRKVRKIQDKVRGSVWYAKLG